MTKTLEIEMTNVFLPAKALDFLHRDRMSRPEKMTKLLRRPHEILEHAQRRIESSSSEFDLSDGVCALKRSIMLRMRNLRAIYKIKHIPIIDFPKDQFLQLQQLGLLRPLLLDSLFEIRRLVEHHDQPPPSKTRCEELCEFTWYFLKSTDPYIGTITDGLLAIYSWKDTQPEYELNVDIKPGNNWNISLSGIFPSHWIRYKREENMYKLNCEEYFTTDKVPQKYLNIKDPFKFEPERYKPDDIHFSGTPDPHFTSFLIKKYFSIQY